jgi:hypothetical protein
MIAIIYYISPETENFAYEQIMRFQGLGATISPVAGGWLYIRGSRFSLAAIEAVLLGLHCCYVQSSSSIRAKSTTRWQTFLRLQKTPPYSRGESLSGGATTTKLNHSSRTYHGLFWECIIRCRYLLLLLLLLIEFNVHIEPLAMTDTYS